MKILEKEIALRDETRATEQARPGLDKPVYQQRAEPLAETQDELKERTSAVITKISQLPNGEVSFVKELALLNRVRQVMGEAYGLLTRPETGPETIAAETEVIELLLQTRRINPKGGGGGGSRPGGGGGGETQQAALALIGAGDERQAQSQVRTVSQTTGVSGGDFPAEFRSGLDAYFGALEGGGE